MIHEEIGRLDPDDFPPQVRDGFIERRSHIGALCLVRPSSSPTISAPARTKEVAEGCVALGRILDAAPPAPFSVAVIRLPEKRVFAHDLRKQLLRVVLDAASHRRLDERHRQVGRDPGMRSLRSAYPGPSHHHDAMAQPGGSKKAKPSRTSRRTPRLTSGDSRICSTWLRISASSQFIAPSASIRCCAITTNSLATEMKLDARASGGKRRRSAPRVLWTASAIYLDPASRDERTSQP